jgi:hypothetical protein
MKSALSFCLAVVFSALASPHFRSLASLSYALSALWGDRTGVLSMQVLQDSMSM